MSARRKIAFRSIAIIALRNAENIVARWLPGGRREGREWVAINPTRSDAKKGSFKVNLNTGCWSDFATGAAGGDLISLAAYLHHLKQSEAAVRVGAMLGVDPYE
ncbi:MAG: hypothetical protein KGL35_21900 [Bradyrhizobium sp.]|uniref:hypothetical protein n=1 Tax=Bradyrhizobium sp. TaxID=376 RepID=UPI001C284AA0|nr:hypothetical protein [Bradyrhizobium sp.]MBU6463231.1 hypothetical protein [Pseudomonadota bacterium]MDE2068101.1 hypothetical protein [Bradyrhizobium sp.]MDE2471310.1 hypothetical protein [Bradyrhizobium sp.]